MFTQPFTARVARGVTVLALAAALLAGAQGSASAAGGGNPDYAFAAVLEESGADASPQQLTATVLKNRFNYSTQP